MQSSFIHRCLVAIVLGLLAGLSGEISGGPAGGPSAGLSAQESTTLDARFPASNALAEGISPEGLNKLEALIQKLVDDEEIVGGELLVIKNGNSILHEAYGWSDLEAQVPMTTGSVFCVRSMTKPLIGVAIQMLIKDKQVRLSDRAMKFLPEFDADGFRDITIEQLLQHTSGLPMSEIMNMRLDELDGIRAVTKLGPQTTLLFEPGSAFSYSDQGTDTLTAIVEVASGMAAAEFVQTRVLDRLGMRESACVMSEDHPLRGRALPKYVGAKGAWSRFWSPDDKPLFPFFLGSQGLYSTLHDYARFCDLWLRRGRGFKSGEKRILSLGAVRKTLKPGPYAMDAPTGFPGLRVDYGYLMQLWTAAAENSDGEPDQSGDREVVALGHTGSDGTHAWAFPKQKAMVLFFTQSRNNATGLRVEEMLGELLLGVPFDANQAAPPFEEYTGYYREDKKDDLYRAVIQDGDDLALEILGKGVVPLSYIGEDRWKMQPNPSTVLAFARDDQGTVTGYAIGDHKEYRFEPSPDLPSVAEIGALVAKAHRLDLLETLGPIRMNRSLTIESLKIEGDVHITLAAPDRFRVDSKAGEEFEHLAFDGQAITYSSSQKDTATLEGQEDTDARKDNPFARWGDWNKWHPSMRVIQKIERSGRVVFLLRSGDTSAPALSLYVEASTGLVLRQDSMTFVDGMGRIGQRTTFGDFEEVSGMTFPFRTETQLANPMIGPIVTRLIDVEFGVDLEEGAFNLLN